MTRAVEGHADRFRVALEGGAAQLGLVWQARWTSAFMVHYQQLLRWNATHNLTRIVGPEEAARKHYLDCLIPLLAEPPPSRFVDVGTGAGFPGFIAAVLWPDAEAVLVEPSRKRASFVQLVAGQCGLSRLRLVQPPPQPKAGSGSTGGGRIARPPAENRAALVLSRATFAKERHADLLAWLEPPGSLWVWGTQHDAPTWEETVGTWRSASSTSRSYVLPGGETRVLWGARVV